MQIAIIVDDNGTGYLPLRSRQLRAADPGPCRDVARAASSGRRRGSSTTPPNAEKVAEAIVQLTARPGNARTAASCSKAFSRRPRIRRNGRRSVRSFVAVTVGGEEHSTLPAHHVLDQIAKSGSTLYVISVANSSLRQTRQIDKPASLLEENLNLSEVLGEGPKQSGGSRESHRRRARHHPGTPADRGGAEESVCRRLQPAAAEQVHRKAQRVGQAPRRDAAGSEQGAGTVTLGLSIEELQRFRVRAVFGRTRPSDPASSASGSRPSRRAPAGRSRRRPTSVSACSWAVENSCLRTALSHRDFVLTSAPATVILTAFPSSA